MDIRKIKLYEEMFQVEEKDLICHEGMSDVFCKECNTPATTHGLSIWECSKCGQLFEQMIDNSAEWRNYTDEPSKDNVRCSVVINKLLPQSSKGTIMLSTSTTNNNIRRSQKVHSWNAMTYKERCLNNIFKDITLRSLHGHILSNVTKLAHEYYKIISELHVARGIMRKGLIAACLFMACKKQGVPRTCQEIADIFQIDDKWVTKGNKKFTELWNMTDQEAITYKEDCQSQDYLARFCSNLIEEHSELLNISRKISTICKNNYILSQNTPISIAASSIYIATIHLNLKEKISRTDIAKAAKTSQVTISKCYKEMIKNPNVWKYDNIKFK